MTSFPIGAMMLMASATSVSGLPATPADVDARLQILATAINQQQPGNADGKITSAEAGHLSITLHMVASGEIPLGSDAEAQPVASKAICAVPMFRRMLDRYGITFQIFYTAPNWSMPISARVVASDCANPPSVEQRPAMAAAPITMATNPGLSITQAQQDRLNRVAQFLVTAPMCEKLGMKLAPEFPTKVAVAQKAETAPWPVKTARLDQLEVDAISRQSAIYNTDLEAASGHAKTEAQLRQLPKILLRYGRTCMAATADPIFASLIVPPPDYNLEKAVTNAADEILEEGGFASWQTPKIQARGDLMKVAGTCRSRIGAARSDALVREYGQSDDQRVRDYYSKSFDEGLDDPTIISTLAGCNRVIMKIRAKAS
jgi:hypothetical protein